MMNGKNIWCTEILKHFVIELSLFIKQSDCIIWSIQKKQSENQSVAKTNKRKLIPLPKCY